MRHKIGLAVLTAFGALIMALPATAATTLPFNAQFPHDSPCGENTLCGDGTLQGYGHVTTTVTFDVIDSSPCLIVPAERVITLDSDGSALVLDVDALACPVPGGFLLRVSGTWTIASGTGVFAGATGGGELFGTFHPQKSPVHYRGTITLP